MNSLSISLEQAQKIINANSIEELDNIKSSLSNQLENIQIDNNNNQNLVVRILSSKEYDKYIVNGTCDGSITQSDENVWHIINTIGESFWADSGPYFDKRFERIWATQLYYYPNYNWITHSYRAIYTATRFLYFNISQNNNINKAICRLPNIVVYDIIANYYDSPSGSSGISRDISESESFFDKNQSKKEIIIWSGDYHSDNINQSSRIYINKILCFRPVFQYKDNSKSKNIYC